MSEDSEVNPKERQINDEGYNNKTDGSGKEVFCKVILSEEYNQSPFEQNTRGTHHGVSFTIVEDIPEINKHGTSNGSNSEDSVDFRSPRASHEYASSNQPSPPLSGEFPLEELVMKSDIWGRGLTSIVAF